MKNKLLIENAYVNGKFITAAQQFKIINPATNKPVGKLPNLTVKDCAAAIKAADKAWIPWRERALGQRIALVKKLYDTIQAHQDELAEIMTLESGKPLTESLGEVAYANSFMEWFVEEGKRAYGETIPTVPKGLHMQTTKQSVGVVAAITPWNFPLAMITRKIAPALVAGCTIILKPASQTPFTAIALAKLAHEVGFPKGVLNVVTSKDSKGIGKEMSTNSLVRKISFTGSTEVGKTLIEQAASTIKRVSMELGGNAPFIVFEDANIDKAVEGAIAGKFRNAGQTCVSINRFYVHEKIYDTFAKKLATAVALLQVGNGLKKGVQVGPLINAQAVEKVKSHVEDATAKGANISAGGKHLGGNFFEPTVLVDVAPDSIIAKEETFGPICALFKFKTEAEAIQLANDTAFGLAAYFYSDNIHTCHRVAQQIEAGMIGINIGLISNAAAPFGGIKQSGVGREGSRYGLDEYLEIKYLCFGEH